MKKRLSIICSILVIVFIFTACGNASPGVTTETKDDSSAPVQSSKSASQSQSEISSQIEMETVQDGEVIQIPLLMGSAGNDANTIVKEFQVKSFNEKYAGQYEAVVEWLPGVAEDIRAKFKMLNASNDLPAVVSEMGAEPAFADLLFRNNRLVDLKPAFDASPEWQKNAIPESVIYNTQEDGRMLSAPSAATSYTGIYYNKEYFAEAGIDEFPKTWDAFWDACEKLAAAGYTPLSLHTTETGWCPMLLGTAKIAVDEDGRAFMKQKFPTNFTDPVIIDLFETVKRLFSYSTPDSIGGNYALAANNFAAGITAMIPNGPWMIASLSDTQFSPEGFEEQVGYAMFPGEVMISDMGENFGLGASVDHPENVQQGAIEWIKFLATDEMIRFDAVQTGAFSQVVALTEEDLSGFSPVMREYAELIIGGVPITIAAYQSRWDPITQNEVIPMELISYLNDAITVEELADKMTASAEQYAADNA